MSTYKQTQKKISLLKKRQSSFNFMVIFDFYQRQFQSHKISWNWLKSHIKLLKTLNDQNEINRIINRPIHKKKQKKKTLARFAQIIYKRKILPYFKKKLYINKNYIHARTIYCICDCTYKKGTYIVRVPMYQSVTRFR